MRSLRIAVCFLALGLSGCWTLEPQYIPLDPEQVAMLEARFGTLETGNEALRAEVEKILGASVYTVRVTDGKVEAVLPPALSEAIEKSAEGFFDRILTNPSAPDLLLALLTAAGVTTGVLKTRTTLRKKAKVAKVAEAVK